MNCFLKLLIGRGTRTVRASGFIDTGNTLKDISTGKNVIVASPEIMYELMPNCLHNILSDYIRGYDFTDRKSAIYLPEGLHLVPYHTVSTSSDLMLAFDCDFLFINNRLVKDCPLIGASRSSLTLCGTGKCVLLNSVYMRKVKKNDKHHSKSRL